MNVYILFVYSFVNNEKKNIFLSKKHNSIFDRIFLNYYFKKNVSGWKLEDKSFKHYQKLKEMLFMFD